MESNVIKSADTIDGRCTEIRYKHSFAPLSVGYSVYTILSTLKGTITFEKRA